MTNEVERVEAEPSERRRVTLQDVAEVAGVSGATASRALRNDPQISERTRRAIRSVADQLHYIPNAAARSLANRASHTLGIVVPDVTDPVHGQFVSGFELEAARMGYVLLVSNSEHEAPAESRAIQTFLGNQADGIAVFSGVLDPTATLLRATMGNVLLVCPENLSALSNAPTTAVIRMDEAGGIDEAIRTAVVYGHRRIGFLAGPTLASNIRRRQAAVAAMQELGGRLSVYESDGVPIAAVAARIRQDGCEAVLCYDDQLALVLLDAFRMLGVRVPEDIGVVGFDGIPFAQISNPRLTTLSVPYREMGALACRMLLEQARTGEIAPPVTVPVKLELRESLGDRRVA